MEAAVKRVWSAQLAFPITQFALLTLAAYINIYEQGHYDPKFGKAGSFELFLRIIALVTAVSSLLYSITFLLNINSILPQARTMRLSRLLLPIVVCALIQVGIYFPIEQFGLSVLIFFWLFLTPPALAWLSVKFIADEQQPDFD